MSSGTSKIVESIMSEAQEKADVIIQDANAEVSAIQANAEKTAEAEKTKILENGKKQSDMRYQQIISEAKMNARRAELGAKEEVIEAAFNQAIGELKVKASSGDAEYEDSLSKMIKEAADELGSNDLIIQLNEADTNKLKAELSSDVDINSFKLGQVIFTLCDPVDIAGGAIVKSLDGSAKVEKIINDSINDRDEYETVLAKLIKEAADEIGHLNLGIHLNDDDTNIIKEGLSANGLYSFQLEDINLTIGEPIDAIGGAILKTSNGEIEVNNTIDARLERFKSILRSEVAEVLFK
nr:V-type ATP synthase subunit E family protein [uncultured Methanobrevibacter sp.]